MSARTAAALAALAAFMTERLDGEERLALAATQQPWRTRNLGHRERSAVAADNGRSPLLLGSFEGPHGAADALHAVLHDPARTLLEVAAKRARLALMTEAQEKLDKLLADDHASRMDQAMAVGRAAAATVAVKHDAAVYSTQPGYRPEWAVPE